MRARASAYFFSFSLRLLLVLIALFFALLLLLPLEPFEMLLLERFMIFIFPTFVLPFVLEELVPTIPPVGAVEAEDEIFIC